MNKLTVKDSLEIAEMSRKVDRWTLENKLNKLIYDRTDIEKFIDETFVFNRFHMCVLIKLLEKTEVRNDR